MAHLNLQLDFRSDVPLYTQIAEYIQHQVLTGALKPGEQLPTVRQMAIDLRINFNTVARAYHILDEQRLISTQRGRGTYIWDNAASGEPPPPIGAGSDQETDREQQASCLVRDFLDSAARTGFGLDEIQAAFAQEIRRRSENSA